MSIRLCLDCVQIENNKSPSCFGFEKLKINIFRNHELWFRVVLLLWLVTDCNLPFQAKTPEFIAFPFTQSRTSKTFLAGLIRCLIMFSITDSAWASPKWKVYAIRRRLATSARDFSPLKTVGKPKLSTFEMLARSNKTPSATSKQDKKSNVWRTSRGITFERSS